MSHPALEHLVDVIDASTGKHIRLGFRRYRVLRYLSKHVLNFKRPVDVKVTGLAEALHLAPRHVIEALDWLVANGYLEQHGRGERRVRSLTLEYDFQPKQAA